MNIQEDALKAAYEWILEAKAVGCTLPCQATMNLLRKAIQEAEKG